MSSLPPAPSPSPGDAPRCLILDGSTPCGPDYNGYPVLGQYFATVGDFSNAINNFIGNLDNVANSFVTGSGCSSALTRPAVNGLRFQASVWCASAVNDAITGGCTFSNSLPPRGPLLCDSQCSIAVSTLTSILGNSTICPTTNLSQETSNIRNATLSTIRTYCTNARSNQPTNGNNLCSNGVPAENRFCGWRDLNLANQMCSTMSSDPCCSRLLSSTSGTPLPAASNAAGNSQGAPASSLGVLLPILVTILLLVIVIIAGVFGYRYWRRKRQSVNDSESTPSPDVAAKSPTTVSKMKGLSFFSKGGHSAAPALTAPAQETKMNNAKSELMSNTSHLTLVPPSPQLMKNSPSQDRSSMIGTGLGVAGGIAGYAAGSMVTGANNTNQQASMGPPPGAIILGAGIPVESEGIPKGAKAMVVIHPYQASLEDELTLELGADIYLIQDFDDGWGLGLNPTTGRQGAFPLICCIDADEAAKKEAEWQASHRGHMAPLSAESDRTSMDIPTPTGQQPSTASSFDPIRDYKRLSFGANKSHDRLSAIRASFRNSGEVQIAQRRSSAMFSPRFSASQSNNPALVHYMSNGSSPLASNPRFNDILPQSQVSHRPVNSVTNMNPHHSLQPVSAAPSGPLPVTPISPNESALESDDEDDNMPLAHGTQMQFKRSPPPTYTSSFKTDSVQLQVPINISPVNFSPLMGDDFDPR